MSEKEAPAPRLQRRCRICRVVGAVDDWGIKPAWVFAEHGPRLARFVETRPPAPCGVCGGAIFQYWADRPYFHVLYDRMARRPMPAGLPSPVDVAWAAYQQTLATEAP